MRRLRGVVRKAWVVYRMRGFWRFIKEVSIYLLRQHSILPVLIRRMRFYVFPYAEGIKLYRSGAAIGQIVLYGDTISEPQQKNNVKSMIKAFRKVSTLITFDYWKLARQYGQSRMNEILVQTAIDFEPDLIYLGNSGLVYGSTIKKIKQEINTCVIHFYGGFRWEPQPWVVDIGKYADCTLFYNKDASFIKQYEDLGVTNTGFWWVGTDLVHDEEREKIAGTGRQEILAHHTWDMRIAEMMKIMRDVQKGSGPQTCNHDIVVSIIMPTYNMGKIIERSIKSVLRQSLTNFELIVVDDASTDNTGQIVKSMNDNRVRYVRRKINHLQQYKKTGILDNPRNDGLKIARGKYTSYLDSDDMYRSSFLKVMSEYLEKNPDVGLVYCDSVWYRNLDGKKEIAGCSKSIDFDNELMKKNNIIGTIEVMHRREVASKVGFFKPIKVRCSHPGIPHVGIEDWDYWFRVSEHFKIKHLPVIMADHLDKTSAFYWDKNFDPEPEVSFTKNRRH